MLSEFLHILMWSLTFTDQLLQAWGALKGIVDRTAQNSAEVGGMPNTAEGLATMVCRRLINAQQDGAEFCTAVLSRMLGLDWGMFEGRRQFDVPEKHALH